VRSEDGGAESPPLDGTRPGLLLRFSCLQDANEVPEALDHRPDVVLGEHRHWTALAELLLGGPAFGLDLAKLRIDDGGSVPASRAAR